MKIFKTLVLSTLISSSVWAAGENVETVNLNEVLSNPAVNASNYQFPNGTGAGVLYNNGSLVNGVGTGAGGLDESILQTTSLGMNSLGFGHQLLNANRIADDFTITGTDWTIDTITFFAYQTGAVASTITAVNLQIWDGVPGDPGSTVVFGDETTNIMSSSVNSNILRVSETTGGATNRQIAASTVAVNIVLSAGTYWLDWQSDGSAASGPWAPPITIAGQAVTGNGLQSIGGVWAALVDGGANSDAQGLPFVINGTSGPIVIIPIPVSNWIGLSLLVLLLGFATRRFILVKE
jgi:hypothetical protein